MGTNFQSSAVRTFFQVAALLVFGLSQSAQAADPVIDIWYGDPQPFGHIGNPQTWVNILGNVSDLDGIQSLTYTLNSGASQTLSMGPDTRRLLEAGDFNVEIDFSELVVGANIVTITAVDTLNNTTVRNVTLDYVAGMVWPFSYTADWSLAAMISDVAQVVDGQWAIGAGGIRPSIMGYDRTFVIGDLFWSDYEVVVPITIHDIDPNGFIWPSVSPGIGFTNRWTGHTTLVIGEQPHAFWQPSGGGAWYDAGGTLLRLFGSTGGGLLIEDPGRTLINDVQYLWKLRMETLPGGTTFYGMKVWEQGQTEPVNWDFSGTDGATGLLNGSTIFVAHHVDATYGNVVITDLASDTVPPVISNTQVLHGTTSAQIRWNTDEPATGSVDYGLTAGYEIGTVAQPVIGVSHSVLLPSLTPGNTYHYRINATDARSNSASTPDMTFLFTGVPGIISDDFSSPTLDTSVWTFVNPLGDATLTMTGTQAEIWMPDTAIHDVWTGINTLPRLKQGVPDEDFEIEAKFESMPTQSFQSQGILIEEADTVVLRFEFHQVNGQNKIFAASIVPTAQTRLSQSIALSNPMYMRVARAGDLWTFRYSYDGLSWIEAISFTQQITTTAISVYGGSANVANTATVDYLFNTAAPIVPEDGTLAVNTAALPGGTVAQVYPDQALVASGGAQPYNWSVTSGSLPPGLTMSAAGVISGTPTSDIGSPFNFQVQVEDATLATATADLVILITPPLLPSINPIVLPVGAVGALYPDQTLTGTGGIGPYTWTVISGTLPPGLTLSTAGTISGTPTSDAGSPYSFTVELEDAVNATATANLDITILGTAPPTLGIDPVVLPNATASLVYADQTLTVSGGFGPYSWSIPSGSLPPGLTLSSGGVISGTPTTEVGSPFAFTVAVTDAMFASDTANLSIAVDPAPPPLVIDPIVPVDGQVGTQYIAQTLTATGGVPPYGWTVSSGTLPPGLALSAAGVISGTPTDATGSPFNFTAEVADAANPTATDTINLSITVTVPPPLVIDVVPLTAKPGIEAPINRQFIGMAAVPGVNTPTTRIPLIDDGRLINDITSGVVANTGGGIMVVENGAPAMDVNPGFVTHFPHWPSVPSLSLDNPSWTIFIDVDIINTQGDFPAIISQRSSAGSGFWQLNRSDNGVDIIFGWKVGAVFAQVLFPGGWPGLGRHQVVLTRDNGTFTYYVDGVQRGQESNANPLPGATVDHDVLLGVLELLNFTQNRLDARYHNVWINTHQAISGADASSLQANPWQIYADINLPGGTTGQAYPDQTLTVSGGTAPYTWSVASGALPPGLTLNSAGVISGTPTTAAGSPFSFTAQVTDNDTTIATQLYSIEIQDPILLLEVDPVVLPDAFRNAAYPPQTLTASNGQLPYTWSIVGGSLPTGLTLSPGGVISGTPTALGTGFFTVQVMDALSATATADLLITVKSLGYVGPCGACHSGSGF